MIIIIFMQPIIHGDQTEDLKTATLCDIAQTLMNKIIQSLNNITQTKYENNELIKNALKVANEIKDISMRYFEQLTQHISNHNSITKYIYNINGK